MCQNARRPLQSMPNGGTSQSGVALVTVLLIIALITTLQAFMLEQQHLLTRRISNQNAAEQGFHYAEGVNAWAARILHEDANRASDYWQEDWAKFGQPEDLQNSENGAESPRQRSQSNTRQQRDSFSLDTSSQQEEKETPVIDFGFDGLEYQIIDLQARYNLNNLGDKNPANLSGQKTIFLNLLDILEIGEFDERERLYGALVDWIDENDLIGANGYESSDYQVRKTPYYAADQMLTTLGELKFVEGFSDEIIAKLKPYVTALPITTARINLNTASTEVVAALSSGPVTDLAPVEGLLAERENEAFLGFDPSAIQRAITAIIGVSAVGRPPIQNMLQTNSQFFEIKAGVSVGDTRFCMRTQVLRQVGDTGAGSTPGVSVLRRQYDTLCSEEESAGIL